MTDTRIHLEDSGVTATTIDIRKIVLPEKATKAERERLDGYLVEVKHPIETDTKGQMAVTVLNGPMRGREIWMDRMHMVELELRTKPREIDIDTKGDW